MLPEEGEVRMMSFTDKQFEHMEVFHGLLRRSTETAPEQVSLF